MKFSDTTNKDGLIQECEFWTTLGDAGISSNSFLLSVFTNRINRAYDDVMPLVLSMNDTMRWDDTNHTDHPIATFPILSGQHDYEALSDANGKSVLNITRVLFLDGASSTEYRELPRITLDDPRAVFAMSPNPTDTGVPEGFLEKDNVIFLYPEPNYSKTAGVKIFFERIPDYFTSADTTQTPGIPAQFHQLLALHASHDWLLVNKAENAMLISRVEAKIEKKRKELEQAINARNPVRQRMTGSRTLTV